MTEYVHADRVPADILAMGDTLARIRHDIHQHPEIGSGTIRTCSVIARELVDRGIHFTADRVHGAVIAVVEGSRPGVTIALRADMDALAVADCSRTDWKSAAPGLAHACGHDGHIAWLIGTLDVLQQRRDFPGRVVGIFQPAEEIGGGARRVVDAGVLEEYGPVEIYAAHGTPSLPKGLIGVRAGSAQASCDFFYITLKGRSAHAARPQHALDPITTAALLASSFQTILSRRLDPFDPAVLSICAIRAGDIDTPNVIPDHLAISGTIRAFDPEVRSFIEREMRRMTEHIAAAQGLEASVRIDHITPPLVNAPGPAAAAKAMARELFGPDGWAESAMTMAGEDFAEFVNRVPGTMIQVGLRDEDHEEVLHNPAFDFNDAVLPATVWYLSELTRSRLEALTQAAQPAG